jgi:putative inorganic carbon (hco3(-)) transporter
MDGSHVGRPFPSPCKLAADMALRAQADASGQTRTFAFAFACAAVGGGVGVLTAIDILVGLLAAATVAAAVALAYRLDILAYGLVATIFFGEAFTVAGVTIGRIVAPIALLVVAIKLITDPVRLSGTERSTIKWVGAYSVVAVASFLWTQDLGGSIYALASLAIALTYMGSFALLIRHRAQLKALIGVAATSSVVLGIWWLVAHTQGVSRFSNEAGDPNYFAVYQVITLLLVLALASSMKRSTSRTLLLGAIVVIAASIIATLSRGGVLTLSAAALALLALPARTLFRSWTQKAAFFVAALIGLAIVMPVAWGQLQGRFEEQREGNIAGARGDLWLSSWRAYLDNPALGIGHGAYAPLSFDLIRNTPGANLANHRIEALREGRRVHNAYLESLAELGPLGLLTFVAILFAAGRSLLRTAQRAGPDDPFIRSVSYALVVGLLAFAVSSLFLSSQTSRVLWMILGLSISLPGMIHRTDSSSRAGQSPAVPQTRGA